MFKRTYKIVIDKNQGDEGFKAFCFVLQAFGEIADIREWEKVYIFRFKATRKQFNEMIKGLREHDYKPIKVANYWII